MSRKLPSVTSDIPHDLRTFIDRVRDIITNSGANRFVTADEIISGGIANSGPTGSLVSPSSKATTKPSTPQNLTATGSLNNIIVRWDDPNYLGHSVAEVYRNTIDNIFTAELTGTSASVYYVDSVGYAESYYYWVRFVNTSGKFGEYYSADGVLGVSQDSIVYTADDLRDDLASGAANVIAGGLNSDTKVIIEPTYIALQHKDAVLNGSSGAYSGATVYTALGITATGILGGYNRQSDGQWQDTLAIEAATGDLTVLGTIKANSVIEVGAYLGGSTVNTVLSDVASKLTVADLASGAANVIAGGLNSDTKVIIEPTYIALQHKDAVLNGSSGAYSGATVYTALGITATGILGGYNRPSDGQWQNTLAIEAATGDLTVLGTIKANSVIEVGAYLGGSTVNTVLSDVSSAVVTANNASSAVASKLNKSGSDILSGAITFSSAGGFKTGTISIDGSGNATGAGVAFTSKGIVGRNNSATTFTLNSSTGEANFAGNISTEGDATFAGKNTSTVLLSVGGGPTYVDYSVYATTDGTASIYPRTAVLGNAPISGSQFNIGVMGIGKGTDTTLPYVDAGVGVYGEGGVFGGWFVSANSAGAGVYAYHVNSNSPAIHIGQGIFKWGSVNIASPDGGTTKYLRADGQWVTLSTSGTGTVTSVSGTGSVSGLSLSGTVTTSGNLTLGGSLSLVSGQVTGALGYTPVSPSTLTNYATASDTIAYIANQLNPYGKNFSASNNVSGVSFTVSGSGTNNVTYSLSSTSDRSLKTNIQPSTVGMEFVRQLTPVSYYYVDDPMFGFKKKMYGLIANDVQALVSEESSLVYTNESGPLDGKLAIDYASYVAPIITALKELDARIAQLEAANG